MTSHVGEHVQERTQRLAVWASKCTLCLRWHPSNSLDITLGVARLIDRCPGAGCGHLRRRSSSDTTLSLLLASHNRRLSPQSFAARLVRRPQAVRPYIDLFTTVFLRARYYHDDRDRARAHRRAAAPSSRPNPDSHLDSRQRTFAPCVSYVTRRHGPVSFIDLDGVNAASRADYDDLVGYNNEMRWQRKRCACLCRPRSGRCRQSQGRETRVV